MKFLAIFAAAIAAMTAAGCAHADDHDKLAQALNMLRDGGNIIVLRHATSPSGQRAAVGMTSGCELAPGRGLSAQGLYEARFIAEWFAENGVKIDKTYTSDMCRSYDTARLVAAAGNGPVIPKDEMKSDDPAIAEAFKASIAAEFATSPKANILLVSHSNITPLYWSGPLLGEEETPSGRIHVVRDGATVRIDVNPTVLAAPKVVE